MIEKLQRLVHNLTEVESTAAQALERRVVAAIEPRLDRARFTDSRRHRPLSEWQHLWDALVWNEKLVTRDSIVVWMDRVGPCHLLLDDARGRAWLVPGPNVGMHFTRQDAYLVPLVNPAECYISPHEAYLGPYLLPLV